MPTTKAQQKAVAKYENANYDKFLVRVDKDKKSTLQTHAAAYGESLNGFVNRAIDETVERDSINGIPNPTPLPQKQESSETTSTAPPLPERASEMRALEKQAYEQLSTEEKARIDERRRELLAQAGLYNDNE